MASCASELSRGARGREQKQRLESLPSVLFCDVPPQSTLPQRHCRRLILLPARPCHSTLEDKRAAAREVISGAYSRRKLKWSRPLLDALGTAAQLALISDDDAVTKGETLKVSRDRHCQDTSSLIVRVPVTVMTLILCDGRWARSLKAALEAEAKAAKKSDVDARKIIATLDDTKLDLAAVEDKASLGNTTDGPAGQLTGAKKVRQQKSCSFLFAAVHANKNRARHFRFMGLVS